ncbi:MAG: rhomboid family intramembrane serine protease [Bacteroidales bacterium]|nr:rhomboid family intramembrane serine protease [Bacteroidales bacterium]
MGTVRAYLLSARVTWWLIAVNVAVWCVICAGADPSATWLGCDPADVFARPWTLLTYSLTHSYAVHLAVNCLALAVAGCIVEHIDGPVRALLLYVVCALAGAAAYIGLNMLAGVSYGVLTGASAAILGMMAYAACIAPGRLRLPLALAVALLLVFGLTGDNPGGTAAHFGGTVAGVAVAWITSKDKNC